MTNSKVLNGVSVSNAQRKLVGFQLPNILGDLQKKCILFTPEVLIITHFAVISQGTPYAVFSIINSSPSLAFFRVLQYIGSNSPIFPEENGAGSGGPARARIPHLYAPARAAHARIHAARVSGGQARLLYADRPHGEPHRKSREVPRARGASPARLCALFGVRRRADRADRAEEQRPARHRAAFHLAFFGRGFHDFRPHEQDGADL